jgi:hypothetical protein
MAIVINGSGTVTGISVGGLPDGIVDAGTLATNSVDSAELIDGSIDNSHMAAASLLPVIDCDADSWLLRMNGNTENASDAIIDWGYNVKLGSNLSESGGEITIGTAGWYFVVYKLSHMGTNTNNTSARIRKGTSNQHGRVYWQGETGYDNEGGTGFSIVECSADDTINVYASGYWTGDSNDNALCYFSGFRLGA